MNEALRVPQFSAAAILFQLLLHSIKSDILYEGGEVAGRIPGNLDVEESGKQNPQLCFTAPHVESTFLEKALQIPASQAWQMGDRG